MAQSPTQKQTLTGLESGAAAGLFFTMFDPALGTLNGVTLSVTTTVSGSVAVENLDLAPVQLSAGLQGSLLLYNPYINQPIGTATASGAAALAVFDGSNDFAGASGTGCLASVARIPKPSAFPSPPMSPPPTRGLGFISRHFRLPAWG